MAMLQMVLSLVRAFSFAVSYFDATASASRMTGL